MDIKQIKISLYEQFEKFVEHERENLKVSVMATDDPEKFTEYKTKYMYLGELLQDFKNAHEATE